MRTRLLLALLTLTVAPGIASAQRDDRSWLDNCRDNYNNDRENYCEVRVAGFKLGGRTLAIDARQNGGIAVHAWNGDSVEVHERIQAQADTREQAAAIGRAIRVGLNDASIRADGPDTERHQSWSVSYDVWVPASAALRLDATNGGISINGTRGTVEARTVNGPLALVGLAGEVRARTSNGPLRVTLAGNHWEGGSLDAETVNGPANLDIPAGYSAHLVTGTVNGPMRFDFPITLQGHISHRIDTNLGSGGATVRAVTTNGPLVLRRS
jgi:Uncharacterized protein conserved in bacteria